MALFPQSDKLVTSELWGTENPITLTTSILEMFEHFYLFERFRRVPGPKPHRTMNKAARQYPSCIRKDS